MLKFDAEKRQKRKTIYVSKEFFCGLIWLFRIQMIFIVIAIVKVNEIGGA